MKKRALVRYITEQMWREGSVQEAHHEHESYHLSLYAIESIIIEKRTEVLLLTCTVRKENVRR